MMKCWDLLYCCLEVRGSCPGRIHGILAEKSRLYGAKSWLSGPRSGLSGPTCPGCPGHMSGQSGPHVRAVRANVRAVRAKVLGPGWGDQNDLFWGDQNDPVTTAS